MILRESYVHGVLEAPLLQFARWSFDPERAVNLAALLFSVVSVPGRFEKWTPLRFTSRGVLLCAAHRN
jgi:hypothetical protein